MESSAGRGRNRDLKRYVRYRWQLITQSAILFDRGTRVLTQRQKPRGSTEAAQVRRRRETPYAGL